MESKPQYKIEVDDPRGEYWLYAEGSHKVSIGRGSRKLWLVGEAEEEPSCCVLSEFFIPAAPNVEDPDFLKNNFKTIAERALLFFTAKAKGWNAIQIERYFRTSDIRWSMPEILPEHLKSFDKTLSAQGFSRISSVANEPIWIRREQQ